MLLQLIECLGHDRSKKEMKDEDTRGLEGFWREKSSVAVCIHWRRRNRELKYCLHEGSCLTALGPREFHARIFASFKKILEF